MSVGLRMKTAVVAGLVGVLAACGGGASTDPVVTTPRTEAPTTTIDPILEAMAEGKIAICNNGDFSDNTDFYATCSSADGVNEWLAPFGECNDGTVIAINESASCSGKDGFKGLLPPDYRPSSGPDDVALCNTGLYSDNTEFDKTCSSQDGVDEWLAPYGECNDGTIIEMSSSASCDGGFKGLLPKDFVPTTTAFSPTTTALVPTTTPQPTGPPEGAVARCNNGDYSDNTDFLATCSSADGVDEWLAPYGECNDGTVITMDKWATCSGHDGFRGLLPLDYGLCLAVPPDILSRTIGSGLTVDGGGELTGGFAVRVKLEHQNDRGWPSVIIGARIEGPGMGTSYGTWAAGLDGEDISTLTSPFFALNALAREFSEWGSAAQPGSDAEQMILMLAELDEARIALECAESA